MPGGLTEVLLKFPHFAQFLRDVRYSLRPGGLQDLESFNSDYEMVNTFCVCYEASCVVGKSLHKMDDLMSVTQKSKYDCD